MTPFSFLLSTAIERAAKLLGTAFAAMAWAVAGAALPNTDMTGEKSAEGCLQGKNYGQQHYSQRYNPYSRNSRQQTASHSFGTFFAEYNPTTLHSTALGVTENAWLHGVSVGFDFFTPIAGGFGVDAGLKGQYLFRSKTVGSAKHKTSIFAVTVPVSVAFDWHVADAVALHPYAGLYLRLNCMGKRMVETGGGRTSVNVFNKDQMGGDDTWNRWQAGWQPGVNVRVSESVSLRGAYWMDFNHLYSQARLRGFNVMVGVSF